PGDRGGQGRQGGESEHEHADPGGEPANHLNLHMPGSPGRAALFHRHKRAFKTAGSGQVRGVDGARGGSANLNVHPFGGGVIGNTTGSGPVIEGSSPSPRAPAGSTRSVGPPLGPIV